MEERMGKDEHFFRNLAYFECEGRMENKPAQINKARHFCIVSQTYSEACEWVAGVND